MTDHAPVVCTLTIKALAERTLEWSDLAQLVVQREELPNGVASTYSLADADEIEDLAGRELQCCGSWLDITTERIDGHLQLKLTTSSPDGLAVIRKMCGL